MEHTMDSAEAARITNNVALTLGWAGYEDTRDLEPVQIGDDWYLSVSDGNYWYLADLWDADDWANGDVPTEEIYSDFCQRVDTLDPSKIDGISDAYDADEIAELSSLL
jgi:hypothetical protein